MHKELAYLESILEVNRKSEKSRFCFHGSKGRLDVIEPRQARCESGRPEGCLNAVYADQHSIEVPIVMALIAPEPGVHESRSGYSRTGEEKLVVTGTGTTFTPGYVHVLSTKTFEWYCGEFISRVPVEVICMLRVDPSILRHIDTIDLQIPIPPPY